MESQLGFKVIKQIVGQFQTNLPLPRMPISFLNYVLIRNYSNWTQPEKKNIVVHDERNNFNMIMSYVTILRSL